MMSAKTPWADLRAQPIESHGYHHLLIGFGGIVIHRDCHQGIFLRLGDEGLAMIGTSPASRWFETVRAKPELE